METSLAVALPGAVACLAWKKKWLTGPGSVSGFVLATSITLSDLTLSLALACFFFLGTMATKISEKLQVSSKLKIISYAQMADEEKTGRSAYQVLATALVPALIAVTYTLCPEFEAPPIAEVTGKDIKIQVLGFYYAYFACNLADTLASEFGVLSTTRPLLFMTLQPVPRGTDGAISLQGTLWSLLGGTLIGFIAAATSIFGGYKFTAPNPMLIVIQYALIGFLGSMLDSALGCILQDTQFLAKFPESWKSRNTLVNLISGSLTLIAELCFQTFFEESAFVVLIFCFLTLLVLADIETWVKRKMLHLTVASLVLVAASLSLELFITRVALIITFLTLPQFKLEHLWLQFSKTKEAKDSGLFMFALTTGFSFYYFPRDTAAKILIPMYYADPIAALVGSFLRRDKPSNKSISSKTVIGSVAFLAVSFTIFKFGGFIVDDVENLSVCLNLVLVELLTGTLDNLCLPVITLLLTISPTEAIPAYSHLTLLAFVCCSIIAHFVLFGNDIEPMKQGISAFRWFIRPHTVIGTTLSLFVVSFIALKSNFTISVFTVLPQLFWMWIAALQANVYIVGLNELVDIEIDIVNKPYLPLASGEFTISFGRSIVAFMGLASLVNGVWHGDSNMVLFFTLLVGQVMGTVYSVELPFMHWKRFPVLAASLIFMVRGGLIQIGFYLYTVTVVSEVNGVPLTPSLALDLFRPSDERSELLGLKPWFENEYIFFLVWFLTVFGVGIALFKDIPDIAGDEKNDIMTFAVRFGARKMVNIVNGMFSVVYTLAAIYWQQHDSMAGCLVHLALYAWLGNKLNSTIVKGEEAAVSIRSSYMGIWKVFFVEYLIILGLFSQRQLLI